jgi:hypothetical protein
MRFRGQHGDESIRRRRLRCRNYRSTWRLACQFLECPPERMLSLDNLSELGRESGIFEETRRDSQ